MKLFNVIQQSQAQAAAAAEGLKKQRGSGKPTLPAPSLAKDKNRRKQKPNALGQAKNGGIFTIFLHVCLAIDPEYQL